MRQATITVNGRLYDARTGLPIDQAPPTTPAEAPQLQAAKKTFNDIGPRPQTAQHAAAAPKAHAVHHPAHTAHKVHQTPQRSTTLNRQAIHRPAVVPTPPVATPQNVAPTDSASRSPLISRFGPAVVQPTAAPEAPPQQPQDTTPNTTPLHPSVLKALQHKAAHVQTEVPQSSKELKEMLIRERLAEVEEEPRQVKKSLFARQPRLASILASTLSLLILGGYFTYINLTNISMRVAANRAGISAEFPQYRPDGYSLNGPITYAPGEVALNYKSNTNESGFTLTQKASSWDSQGVLDNYVRKQTTTYLTFQQRGVTVYTFNNRAAWINGGLLYTLDGDATLSSDQILRLATSM